MKSHSAFRPPYTLYRGLFLKKIMGLIKASFAILICLLAVMQAQGQGHFDVLQGSFTASPGNAHDSTKGETDVQDMAINIKIPQENKKGDVEVFGLMVSSCSLNNDNGEDLRFWSAGINYSYIFKNDGRSLQLTFVPKVNSDLKNESRDILQLGGVVLATHKKNDRLKYKYGIYYNRECFGHFFVPLAGIEWKPSEKWMVYGTLPMNFTAAYKFADKLTTGFNFTGIITSFRLKNDQYLHKSTNELYGFADFYMTDNLLLQARAGYAVGRSYRLYDADDKMDLGISALKFGDDRRQLNDDMKDGLLLQAGLIYRVKTDK